MAEAPTQHQGRSTLRRRWRLGAAWALTALLVGTYFALPDSDEAPPLGVTEAAADGPAGEPRKLDILEISPPNATRGDAITISYAGGGGELTDAQRAAELRVYAGKEEIDVLARRQGQVVARLPTELAAGRVKIRIAAAGERSKPYDLRVKPATWRKPFRNLVGGFALLLFGIGVFARGVRGAAGFQSAHTLARLARRGPAAGLLSGLVRSSLLAVAPAAAAFLGAQLGAATAPMVTGLIDPRQGLLVVAIGGLWLGLATHRRAASLGWLVLGAGLVALGLQTMRPGFELFMQNPTLLAVVSHLGGDTVAGVALAALVGALLVAILQGPAPVLVLVLVLAQTTARWDLRTALAVLSGSGLGAALGALLTTPAGARSRRLAQIHLCLGAASTVLAAATVPLWSAIADRLVPGVPHEIAWGKRVMMPHLGLHLGAAFALSQLASALVLLPLAPRLVRLFDRARPLDLPGGGRLASVGDVAGVVRAQLVRVLETERDALAPIHELALEGRRSAGRTAEHALEDAHDALEQLLAGAVPVLPDNDEGARLARVVFAGLQVQRSLASLGRQAERLTDGRMTASGGRQEVAPLPDGDVATLREMHQLLADGLGAVIEAAGPRASFDLEAARAREIRMNGLEARARTALLTSNRSRDRGATHLGVLELCDAYETAGNQVYRLAEAVGDSIAFTSAIEDISAGHAT